MNIAEYVGKAARYVPDRLAVVGPDRSMTYAQLDDLTGRLAGALLKSGIAAGDRVALYLPNSTAFAVAYLAVLRAGAVAVSINPLARAGELKQILSDSGARAIFTDPVLEPELAQVAGDLPALFLQIVGWEAIDALAAKAAPVPAANLAREHPAALLYTSGTTGLPKGAELSHGAVIMNVLAAQYCTRTTAADRLLAFVPLSHCFGQNFILNNALMGGATLVILPRFDPQVVWETVQKEQISMLFGVPTAFRSLLTALPQKEAMSSLRFVFGAADTVPAELSQAWEEATGLTLTQGYGLTEAGPFVSFNHLHRFKHGSLGMPVPGTEMQAVDSEGRPVPPGEPGELRVRGPSLMNGYWRNPEATAQCIRDGWLYTGDLGVMDEDGDFFLVDRVKDMINMSGFKIYPKEVEAVLATHPDVADCALVGVPDQQKGQIARAFIVWRKGTSPNPEGLRAWLKERISAYKVPTLFDPAESIPRGPTGKILRKLLR